MINADVNLVLGRQSAGTLSVSDDRSGVSFDLQLPDTSYANDLLVSMRRGDVDGVTLAFYILECHKQADSQGTVIRVIDKGAIVAISIATFSALKGAQVEVDRAIAAARVEGRMFGYADGIAVGKRQAKAESKARFQRDANAGFRALGFPHPELDAVQRQISILRSK